MSKKTPNSSHWGNFLVTCREGAVESVESYPEDLDPTPILDSLNDVHDETSRVARPCIRKGYLDNPLANTGRQRGLEPFVEVPWDEAFDIAAAAISHTIKQHGNQAIYGGSYGWASAGRFHHAQSQIHRFLNLLGGYTASKNSYSAACAEVILPYVFGPAGAGLFYLSPTSEDIASHTDLIVCFGGMALKNTQVNPGGLGAHTATQQVARIRDAGVQVVNFSPIRDDVSDQLDVEWVASRPGSDTAIMLGLAHTIYTNNWHDKAFLERYTVGFEGFLPYLLGHTDGQVKDAAWAADIAACDGQLILNLARRMAESKTLINLSLSVQRTEHGEQPYWMASVLADMLGKIGLPGEGVGFGYGAMHNFGFNSRNLVPFKIADFPQGHNPTDSFIPVAQLADMLLKPNQYFNFNGENRRYPNIELVYWAGGNPYHHHQNLNRLREAWTKPQTIIVNEFAWTSTARFADIVFPANTSLERNDLGISSCDSYITPMINALPSYVESRSDFDIFSGLSKRLGSFKAFTEDKTEKQWLQDMYATTMVDAAEQGIELPKFDDFWSGQQVDIAGQIPDKKFFLEEFRSDPVKHPLATPSGKIEIFSDTIASFAYDDCAGHPKWFEKNHFLGSPLAETYPFHLVSNQPKTRLHSQWDRGRNSLKHKIKKREMARMNSDDALRLGLADGDVIKLSNEFGACLAGLRISDGIAPSIIELPTGAWYDPLDPNVDGSLEVHGNPNVLTSDRGSSSLAQGSAAHSCLVNVCLFEGDLPKLSIDQPPRIVKKYEN